MKQFFWLSPFFLFLFGYYGAQHFVRKREVAAPHVVGKSVKQALLSVSNCGLNLRFLREQVDSDLPEGTILEQVPKHGDMVRLNQHVFVTVSKCQPPIKSPLVLGFTHEVITAESKKLGIQSKMCWLESYHPKNLCFAQSPGLGQSLEKRQLLAYLSLGHCKLFTFPDLKEQSLFQVREFLEKEGVTVDVFHPDKIAADHSCDKCIVYDQKPMAGAIVDMAKRLYVQLAVKESR
ncbi:PASTA domain-containing protein [Candidatus Babeliales bacterium]|nr:PASTA domain-containing protein [Candidatus Babeliales bacterium]